MVVPDGCSVGLLASGISLELKVPLAELMAALVGVCGVRKEGVRKEGVRKRGRKEEVRSEDGRGKSGFDPPSLGPWDPAIGTRPLGPGHYPTLSH